MERLASHKKLLRALFKSAAEGILVVDEQGKIILANPRCLQIFGYTDANLIGEPLEILLSPQNREAHAKLRQGFFQNPMVRPMGVGRKLFGITKDGKVFPLEVSLSHMKVDGALYAIGFIVDITRQKQTEEALQKEKETAQRYLDIAASIFVVLSKEGTVILINRKGCQVLGYKEEEIMGRDWFDFIPDQEKKRVQEVFQSMMLGKLNILEYFENPVLTKQGEERLIEWHNAIIFDEEGLPAAALSSGIDVTEKRKAERDIMKALIEGQEVERERIAKELHDGLGQSLTAMQLNLNSIQAQCERIDPKAKQLFEKLKSILYATTQGVKSIARNLMPGVLRDYGLVKGLEYLCQTLNDIGTVKVALHVFQMDKNLDTAISNGIYRIAQELINNTLKHGKATEINIQLIGYADSVVLMVEDDGTGFKATETENQHGLGLKNMETRIKALKGTFFIDSQPGKGTSVTVEIPMTN